MTGRGVPGRGETHVSLYHRSTDLTGGLRGQSDTHRVTFCEHFFQSKSKSIILHNLRKIFGPRDSPRKHIHFYVL